jgi:hypothetical protein
VLRSRDSMAGQRLPQTHTGVGAGRYYRPGGMDLAEVILQMKTLVFPEFVLCHFVAAWQCRRCGRSGEEVTMRYLTITRTGASAELAFPIQCRCGESGRLNTGLPMLFFGYVLARLVVLEHIRRHRLELPVQPRSSQLFAQFAREYEQILIEMGVPSSSRSAMGLLATTGHPADHERFGFFMAEHEWNEFLRRLGLKEGESRPSQ